MGDGNFMSFGYGRRGGFPRTGERGEEETEGWGFSGVGLRTWVLWPFVSYIICRRICGSYRLGKDSSSTAQANFLVTATTIAMAGAR